MKRLWNFSLAGYAQKLREADEKEEMDINTAMVEGQKDGIKKGIKKRNPKLFLQESVKKIKEVL